MMNIKSGSMDQFQSFSQFESLKEFNNHMEMWLAVHKYEFTKGELVGLKRLVRFAAKIPGVSNAKIGTLLKAIHEEYEGNGISRSTFKRMVQKAIAFGILTVHETERKNGSQSSNLYVFNRFLQNEPPEEDKLNHHNKTINLSKTNIKENNKRTETIPAEQKDSQSSVLDHTFTSDTVPSAFTNLVKCFFPEAKIIEEYWRMTSIAAYHHNYEQDKEEVLSISIHAFKQLISKLKSSSIRKPIAYFYGILNKMFEELYFEELFDIGFCTSEMADLCDNNFLTHF
ncbi:hypothetical protein [Bacillus dakarensis]|uniref:hypothetical protein n=1 Tax=Robertmurraya dakarensis TaxID=1926278 RepID=UPI001F17BDC4|nr:hypothetical protein [Bacillus dakarensis]